MSKPQKLAALSGVTEGQGYYVMRVQYEDGSFDESMTLADSWSEAFGAVLHDARSDGLDVSMIKALYWMPRTQEHAL